MVINPNNTVRLIKGVPFSIDYKDIIQFDSLQAQTNYFNSLPSITFDNVTYVRSNGTIKVKANKESLLDYNYMSFTNTQYGTKTFYAFITGVSYVNPKTSLISFVVDEWQSWCFALTFMPSFIERKHCQRWNSDGTPVINTVPEGLDYGDEYIVKDHQQYNNDLYWIAFVTSARDINQQTFSTDVPTILQKFFLPIYKTTNQVLTKATINTNMLTLPNIVLDAFKEDKKLVNTLVSSFIIEEPPFDFTYTINGDTINIISSHASSYSLMGETNTVHVIQTVPSGLQSIPPTYLRTYSKYGSLTQGITESKLLMYPYSYVQLLDGQGNNFIIKPEYLTSNNIQVKTFISNGLNSKIAHIVQYYRYQNVTLNNCRWELQNGIISSSANNITISDSYSAAYLQGNANTIQQNITNTQLQSNLNNVMAQNTARTNYLASWVTASGNIASASARGLGNTFSNPLSTFANAGNIGGTIIQSGAEIMATEMQGDTYVKNTELQGNLTNEKAITSALAKIQDAKMVADNVSLQSGDVYFTFQNKFNGYCLVYRQISSEYIQILTNYFQKYGYAYHRVETPNLHTRESWDYIRTVDVRIQASINEESIEKIKTIFDNGVTIWHTTQVGNYNLSNNEI